MEQWNIIIYFLLIAALMFVGKFLKTKAPILNKVVIPTALLGGMVGLIISLVFAPIITGEETFYDVEVLEHIVYHALAIGFLALALKRTPAKAKKTYWSTGMLITSTYALQAVIGITLVFLFFSDRFIGSGMLVALGFGQGPGLAMSIGSGWNDFLNNYGTTLGASYAFLGFVFGGTVGVTLINIFSRRRGTQKPISYEEYPSKETVEIDTVKEISILDGLTQQFVIIGVIYGLVYLTLEGLKALLAPLGGAGDQIFGLLVGFNFIIAILYGLLYKTILKAFEAKGKNVRFMTNNYILSNIASFAFNIMITGSVLSITLAFLSTYGIQLIVTSLFAGVATLFYLRFMTKRLYGNLSDEFTVGLFGMLTGVASTGLALLKGIDPNLETPVAEEMVLGSGTAILMALPLFVLLFIPSFTAGTANETLFNWITFIGIIVYTLLFAGLLILRSRKK